MRVQHNIPAMSSYRNYSTNNSLLNKNLEKLSSGYKINRAGDDAAGLAISEKMRAQITGLEVANKNAKDGISVVQTAEGALTEVHDMLNRMYNLAEQSANGTYQASERAKLQAEIDQLNTEIDRIADSTNFNGLKLLNGDLVKQAAYTETITVDESGNDRIIQSVIDDDDKPYEVSGIKTITDQYNEKATTAEFSVDLTSFKFSMSIKGAKATANGTIALTTAVKLKIGDLELTTDVTKATASKGGLSVKITNGAAGTISSASVAKALFYAKASAGATSVKVTINNVDWKMTYATGSGKLTFTQISKPETLDEARANFDVKITLGDAQTVNQASIGGTTAMTLKFLTGSSMLAGTQVIRKGVPEGSTREANTVFKITADDIKDGATIQLGDKTKGGKEFIFKVGADSTVKAGTNQTLIDLSSMDPAKVDLNKALNMIASAATSFTYTFTYNDKNGVEQKAIATFSIGVSDSTSGFPTGIAIKRTTTVTSATVASATPAYFTSLDKFDKLFKIDYSYTEDHEEQSGLVLQIGEDSSSWNQLTVSIDDMHAEALGIGDMDITSVESANAAMDKIMTAIDKVSTTRANLGAIQNRLDHTLNSLSVSRENLQDAEATIRDTDIAEEMMAYTKNSILNQAAQAMLAQANQLPQGVLQLLG